MADPKDQFDVLRSIVEQLSPLPAEDQRMVIRWACEKLGLNSDILTAAPKSTPVVLEEPASSSAAAVDIKTFVSQKNPQSDNHFAATVAYYYRFLAPEKKDAITSDDLQEATRLVGRERLKRPAKTMNNAASAGLLDPVARGAYRINTVGENLVALVLSGAAVASSAPRKAAKKPVKRRSTRK